MKPAATYDIETEDWTTFVVGAIHYEEGTTEVYWNDDQDGERRMAQALSRIEGEVYAHNGGRFDHLWLIDTLGEPCDIVPNSSGIISLRFKDSPALFLDSLRVFPYRLALLTGGEKGSIEHLCHGGHENDENCGGYCAIRREGMSRYERKEVEKYLIGDVVELMHALERHMSRAEEWGFSIRKTLGSTSWHAAEKAVGIEPVKWPEEAWELTRAGYHGGRAEVFQTSAMKGWRCDVNSMYPWALTQPLPVGYPVVKDGRAASLALGRGLPGIYHATIRVPKSWIPPLPVQVKGGLAFPWGVVTGAWPRPEIDYAVSEQGCIVERVHRAVVYQDESVLFGQWISEMYARRAHYGKESCEGRWLKWLCNSLTGKLGSKNESRRIKVRPDISELGMCRCPDFAHACECGGWRPIDETGKVWEQVIKNRAPEKCSHPEWAAYLTGYARAKLHLQLIGSELGDAIYCDTDSCWSGLRRNDLGTGLGEWADEGRFKEFRALGPKSYHAWVTKKGVAVMDEDGNLVMPGEDGWQEYIRMKGIPRPNWEKIKQGIPQKFWTMKGFRRSEGGRMFSRLQSQRKVASYTGGRVLRSEKDVRTYPIEF
jgi:hypothetical protein